MVKFGEEWVEASEMRERRAPGAAAAAAAAAGAPAGSPTSNLETMGTFGNAMSPTSPHSPAGGAASVDSEEEDAQSLARCCHYLIPAVVGAVVLAFLVAIVVTSGSGDSIGTPRAVVFVIEGFKGTAFTQLLATPTGLPNIAAIVAAGGVFAQCDSLLDTRCARAQSGALLGAPFTFQSGPGIASILSGVDANKHQVTNNSFDSMSKYATTSATYPSFFKIAAKNGLRTSAVGAAHLLTSVTSGGQCANFGVADFECGTDVSARCLGTTSCNLNQRFIFATTDDYAGTEESAILSTVSNSVFAAFDSDILVVHLPKLARMAENPAFPSNFYSAASAEYAAEAYVLDAVVGQVMAIIRGRTTNFKENWLVLGVSDHGGAVKDAALAGTAGEEQVIAFFAGTSTSAGALTLAPTAAPTTQMDVAPTVLSWFGIDVSAMGFDGKVQAVCGTGRNPTNCTMTLG